MKKFDIKSIALGFVIGTIGITTVFAASGIKSATLSNAKVTLDGVYIPLNNPLVAVTKEDEKDAKLYMPFRELLEYIGYEVNWNEKLNSVDIISYNQNAHEVIGGNKLQIGIYSTVNGYAQVILEDDNKYIFCFQDISYSAVGKYTIEDDTLTLINGKEKYIFTLDNNKLIFESGEWAEKMIDKGIVFQLLIE